VRFHDIDELARCAICFGSPSPAANSVTVAPARGLPATWTTPASLPEDRGASALSAARLVEQPKTKTNAAAAISSDKPLSIKFRFTFCFSVVIGLA
jgi:hypothetical protein